MPDSLGPKDWAHILSPKRRVATDEQWRAAVEALLRAWAAQAPNLGKNLQALGQAVQAAAAAFRRSDLSRLRVVMQPPGQPPAIEHEPVLPGAGESEPEPVVYVEGRLVPPEVLAWVRQEVAEGRPPVAKRDLKRCQHDLKGRLLVTRQHLRDACRHVIGHRRGRRIG